MVKCEKWACSTLEAGKNKPILYITKTRDFKRFCEINKEKSGILRLPIFGLSDKTWTCGLYHPNAPGRRVYSVISWIISLYRWLFGFFVDFQEISLYSKNVHPVHSFNWYAPKLCIKKLCISRILRLSVDGIIPHFYQFVKQIFKFCILIRQMILQSLK